MFAPQLVVSHVLLQAQVQEPILKKGALRRDNQRVTTRGLLQQALCYSGAATEGLLQPAPHHRGGATASTPLQRRRYSQHSTVGLRQSQLVINQAIDQ